VFVCVVACAEAAAWAGATRIGTGIIGLLTAGRDKLQPLFQGAASAARSPWTLGWVDRGRQIEESLGSNLPPNYPTFDRYVNGIATSIKSVDLGAMSYQNSQVLHATLTRYVTAAQNGVLQNWGTARLAGLPITDRVVQIAVPYMPAAGSAQANVLAAVAQAAGNRALPVQVQYVVVP
jgi:filamentous hemagglutinin